MQTKLTLRLDDSLIERAKRYGKAQDKSVSQLVAEFFRLLDAPDQEAVEHQIPLPPRTRSLLGVLGGATVSEEDHREHQRHKHLS